MAFAALNNNSPSISGLEIQDQMSITGIVFLLLGLVAVYVLFRFAVKIMSAVLLVVALIALGCWLSPEFYKMMRPPIEAVLPFLKSGAEDAVTTAKALKDAAGK